MTNHDDLHDVEARLRAALRERAGDVDTTPALYERVQRQAVRDTWLWRGLAVAGAAAVVAGAFVIVPALLPDPTPFDVVDTPEDSLPSDGPTAAEESQPAVPDGATATDQFVARDLVRAEVQPDGSTEIVAGTRRVRTTAEVASLATGRDGLVVAVLTDGSIGVLSTGGGDAFDLEVAANPNGDGAVPTPAGDGIAWIEGSNLHVLPLQVGGGEVRVLPLEGDVPDDLHIEQWFAQADAQVILATAPGGGLWSIPMDDSDVFNSAPTTPAFVLAEDALDGALLDDLTRVELALDPTGTELRLRVAGNPEDTRAVSLGTPSTDVELSTDGKRLVVHDREAGVGEVLEPTAAELADGMFSWDAPTISAVAPLPRAVVGDTSAAGTPEVTAVGTSFAVRNEDGTTTELPVLEGAEVEATFGLVATRPGSTREAFLVAYENQSEGETSIRFAQVVDDAVARADAVVVVGEQGQQLTELTWSEDGRTVSWTASDGTSGTVTVTVGEAADGSLVVETS